jgi:hypothetical protein
MVYQTRVLQDGSTASRAGDDNTLLKMRVRGTGVIAHALQHDVTLRFCYCSTK